MTKPFPWAILGGSVVTVAVAFILLLPRSTPAKCDPSAVRAGMTEPEVVAICGEPNDRDRSARVGAWYPLKGETAAGALKREETLLLYGRGTARQMVVFIGGDGVRSVQVTDATR